MLKKIKNYYVQINKRETEWETEWETDCFIYNILFIYLFNITALSGLTYYKYLIVIKFKTRKKVQMFVC